MLYVVFHNGLAMNWNPIKWHIGTPKPLEVERSKYKKADYHEQMADEAEARWLANVAYIQVDGDELNLVKKKYSVNNVKSNSIGSPYSFVVSYSIPFPSTNNVVSWYGDLARTILMNL